MKKIFTKSLMALALGATALVHMTGTASADHTVALTFENFDVDVGGYSTDLDGYTMSSTGAYDFGFSYDLAYTNADGTVLDYEGLDLDARYMFGGSMFGVAGDYRWDEINGFSDEYKGVGVAFGWEDTQYSVNATVTSDVDDFGDDYAVTVGGAFAFNDVLSLTGEYDYLSKDVSKREYSVGANYLIKEDVYVDAGYTYIDGSGFDVDQVTLGLGLNF